MPDSRRASVPSRRVRSAVLFAGLLASVGAAVGAGACFIESAQPSTFRFECSASDECLSSEVCSDGLCQQPCGEGLESCINGTVCLNGFCSSVCPIGQDLCPSPQECVSLSAPTEGEADEDEPGSGICTVLCDDEERPCADGQACVFGFCLDECMTVADCGSSEECLPISADTMVCVPSGSGGGPP